MSSNHSDQRTDNKSKLGFSVSLATSVIVHVAILILIGGVVLVPAYVKQKRFLSPNVEMPNEDLPPPPPDMDVIEPPGGSGGAESDTPMQSDAPPDPMASMDNDPSSMDLDLIASTDSASRTTIPVSSGGVLSGTANMIGGPGGSGKSGTGVGTGTGKGVGSGSGSTLFGTYSDKERGEGLEGIFYDLKQTPMREPSGTGKENAHLAVQEFLQNGWTFPKQNFYRATRLLYATNFTIQKIRAETCPEAFGVQDEVQPICWIVHYYGMVEATESGYYRFLGGADDWIHVAMDGKTVFSRSYNPEYQISDWTSKSEYRYGPGGEWVRCAKGQDIKLDILIGERPGGFFYSGLTLQYKEKESDKEMASGFLTIKEKWRPKEKTDPQLGHFRFLNK